MATQTDNNEMQLLNVPEATSSQHHGHGVAGEPIGRSASHDRRMYRAGSHRPLSTASDAGSIHSIETGVSGSRGNVSVTSQTSSGMSIRSVVVTRAKYHEDLKKELQRNYNRNLLLMSFVILMSTSFPFGYNIGVLNQPAQLIEHFFNESYVNRHAKIEQISDNATVSEVTRYEYTDDYSLVVLFSVTNTMYVIGGMIGAFSAGFIANKVGRKYAVIIACVPAFIGAILCAVCQLAKAPELLMIGRLITGINCGMGAELAPMYLLEIAPVNLKGAFGTACQLFCTIGIFVSALFGLREIFGSQTLWPALFAVNVIPSLFFGVLVMFFLPDSPRYLWSVRKDRSAAEKALQFIRRDQDVSTDIEEIITEYGGEDKAVIDSDEKVGLNGAQLERPGSQPKAADEFTMLRLLKSRHLRMPLIIAMFLQVIQQLSGINGVFFYSNGIYRNAGVPADSIQYAVLVTNAINALMTVIAVPLMDKVGRRPLLLVPMVLMILILGLITISLKLHHTLPWMSYFSVGCVLSYVICFAVGLGPIPGMIGAEMFRQGPRPYAMSLAFLTMWIFTAIIALCFEPIQKVTKEYTFIIFLILMIGFTVFVFFLVPETKNKTFEETASKWQRGDKIEVEEMVDDGDRSNGKWSLGDVSDSHVQGDADTGEGDIAEGVTDRPIV